MAVERSAETRIGFSLEFSGGWLRPSGDMSGIKAVCAYRNACSWRRRRVEKSKNALSIEDGRHCRTLTGEHRNLHSVGHIVRTAIVVIIVIIVERKSTPTKTTTSHSQCPGQRWSWSSHRFDSVHGVGSRPYGRRLHKCTIKRTINFTDQKHLTVSSAPRVCYGVNRCYNNVRYCNVCSVPCRSCAVSR